MLGPTARYQTRKDDYESNREPLTRFHAAARRLLPELGLHQLRAGGSGIRARSAPAERTFSDFLIRRDGRQPRLIQAAGTDSPGLTASLAIGRARRGPRRRDAPLALARYTVPARRRSCA